MKGLNFISVKGIDNIGFSADELSIITSYFKTDLPEIVLHFLKTAGKKSNILDTDFTVDSFIRLQKDFRTLIGNDPKIVLDAADLCCFLKKKDPFHNTLYYFIEIGKAQIPQVFYYSEGEVPIGVSIRDDRTEKLGLIAINEDFIGFINKRTELRTERKRSSRISQYFYAVLLAPIWIPILVSDWYHKKTR
ncbi:hypothetical protein [Flavobacterium silvaticum]|uniref:Uncharacterized protein n=1 Tax=Flavobacterium silvaticum TaxID=1852020 RepID=A0A972JF30_9FLAO|nr:hypothetical protein [Flavobacterium silvaticum]NMH26801.1 hypothetical protein [Flavobacterium silvaticum]